MIVTLSNPVNADLGNSQTHIFTIQDDDKPPTVQFALSKSNVTELASPSIVVKLSAPSGRPVTVAFRVARGTATNGIDYQLTDGTATFQPGQTEITIPLTVIDDQIKERKETVVVNLSSVTNAKLGSKKNHTLTILDND